MKTTLAKKEDFFDNKREWFLIDAENQILGKLAVKIADILRGKNKPTYTPHVDTGAFVVVINAEKVKVTGKKEEKQYMFYSGYKGCERYQTLGEFRKSRPEFIIEHAVKSMLPKNVLANQIFKKLKVYAGENCPHLAQNPIKLS